MNRRTFLAAAGLFSWLGFPKAPRYALKLGPYERVDLFGPTLSPKTQLKLAQVEWVFDNGAIMVVREPITIAGPLEGGQWAAFTNDKNKFHFAAGDSEFKATNGLFEKIAESFFPGRMEVVEHEMRNLCPIPEEGYFSLAYSSGNKAGAVLHNADRESVQRALASLT